MPVLGPYGPQRDKERMPVCIGMIGDQNVSVLRDTGCSAVVVKRDLVNEDHMTFSTKFKVTQSCEAMT